MYKKKVILIYQRWTEIYKVVKYDGKLIEYAIKNHSFPERI